MKINRAFKKKFSFQVGAKLFAMDQLKSVVVHKTEQPQLTLKQVGWLDLNKVKARN